MKARAELRRKDDAEKEVACAYAYLFTGRVHLQGMLESIDIMFDIMSLSETVGC